MFIGCGLVDMLGLNLCYNIAINELPLSLAAVLLSLAPAFAIFFSSILFKEKITSRKVSCITLAVTGCLLASGLLESGVGNGISTSGIVFGILAAVFYALYNIFSKLATDKGYHTYTVIFYSVLFISIALIPFADLNIITGFIIDSPVKNLLLLFLHSLCAAILPYIFITLSLLHVEAGTVSILASGGEPIAATVLGMIIFSEIPTLLMFSGLALVVIALALLCESDSKEI